MGYYGFYFFIIRLTVEKLKCSKYSVRRLHVQFIISSGIVPTY